MLFRISALPLLLSLQIRRNSSIFHRKRFNPFPHASLLFRHGVSPSGVSGHFFIAQLVQTRQAGRYYHPPPPSVRACRGSVVLGSSSAAVKRRTDWSLCIFEISFTYQHWCTFFLVSYNIVPMFEENNSFISH